MVEVSRDTQERVRNSVLLMILVPIVGFVSSALLAMVVWQIGEMREEIKGLAADVGVMKIEFVKINNSISTLDRDGWNLKARLEKLEGR